MRVWICGKLSEIGDIHEFCGVFSTEEQAVAQCTTAAHFVGPAYLDAIPPLEETPWPGSYIPLGGGKQHPAYVPEVLH